MVTYISFVLRSLRGPLLPLLAFHIILLFIALVAFVAVCCEAVSSRRPRSFFVKLEPRGTMPMPWIRPAPRVPTATVFRKNPRLQKIRCDLCSWETKNGYLDPKKARAEAGVWWPKEEEGQIGARHLKASAWCGGGRGEGEPAWCPLCASRESEWARWSYHCTNLDIESVMSQYWRAPTGREWERGAVGPVAKEHPGRVPPKAPPPGTSSQAHPGRVPPKAPPPGISSLATQERLAALEEEVARLRLRVDELEQHSPGAATG